MILWVSDNAGVLFIKSVVAVVAAITSSRIVQALFGRTPRIVGNAPKLRGEE